MVVHEAGHAFGITGLGLNQNSLHVEPGSMWNEVLLRGHSTVWGSVLNVTGMDLIEGPRHFLNVHDYNCSPHPFDVMALYALYQSS